MRSIWWVVVLAACAPSEDLPAFGGVVVPPEATEVPPTDEPALECPDGVECVTTLPYRHQSTTVGGDSVYDTYACAPDTDESGPERRYRVTLEEEGFLGVQLSGLPEGVDVDAHLLQLDDADTCLDRGHWAAGGLLPAGDYWVVVDSWVDGDGNVLSGDYTLDLALTTPAMLAAEGLDAAIADVALHAFDVAWLADEARRLHYAITDFSLHSSERRMWLWDLSQGALAWNLHVPHGEGSSDPNDTGYAVVFSNTPGSHQSSLGVMVGAERYVGDFGESMRIDGLEPGFNDNVRSRAIVLHPWEGSRQSYVDANGVCDDTWGCPALDDRLNEEVADFLTDGGLMLFHYPDDGWLQGSAYLPTR